ncbi:hypothetical protein GYMLUDRAFT_252407 [Collybiopsis luxurians FD-317 M1]|uniref:Unplaced genomic scaffold GYMLUscaffold_126, whole genome shotgun sequence n=1 Tax=Collybiopsis luxurians FD-317 M1 TaxID=944289 RepID=A0A0D0C0G9_9AGAR|nr:hypothetical protein GYMLUDRAFT_252407 [Collybiopsis luxurians FD-317 M1]
MKWIVPLVLDLDPAFSIHVRIRIPHRSILLPSVSIFHSPPSLPPITRRTGQKKALPISIFYQSPSIRRLDIINVPGLGGKSKFVFVFVIVFIFEVAVEADVGLSAEVGGFVNAVPNEFGLVDNDDVKWAGDKDDAYGTKEMGCRSLALSMTSSWACYPNPMPPASGLNTDTKPFHITEG